MRLYALRKLCKRPLPSSVNGRAVVRGREEVGERQADGAVAPKHRGDRVNHVGLLEDGVLGGRPARRRAVQPRVRSGIARVLEERWSAAGWASEHGQTFSVAAGVLQSVVRLPRRTFEEAAVVGRLGVGDDADRFRDKVLLGRRQQIAGQQHRRAMDGGTV